MSYWKFTESLKMKNKLEEAFPQISTNHCLETTQDKFWIYDCEEKSRCYITHEDNQFHVLNDTNGYISFLAIDKCIFFDDDAFEKCDCAVFNEKIFSFIEIKKSKLRQKKKNRKKAKAQLISTINIFRDKIDFSDIQLEAYLCIGTSPTRPSITATSIDMILEFEELDTKLFEGCQKVFQE